MAYVFGVADVLAALGITESDWEIQDYGDNRQSDHAVTKDKDGAYVAASEVAHNDRSDLTITLKAALDAGCVASFNLGGAGTGASEPKVVITQFSCKEVFNDHAVLTVTAHRHNDGSTRGHLAGPEEEAVELTVGFGISAVRLGGTLLDCQSSELSGSVEHTDRYTNVGAFLTGASHGLKYECTEEYVESGAAPTVASPWVKDSEDKKQGNGDFQTRTVKAHAYSLA
jgi:hypothetical protein